MSTYEKETNCACGLIVAVGVHHSCRVSIYDGPNSTRSQIKVESTLGIIYGNANGKGLALSLNVVCLFCFNISIIALLCSLVEMYV